MNEKYNKADAAELKKQRLAEKLRENLKRRKSQARERRDDKGAAKTD